MGWVQRAGWFGDDYTIFFFFFWIFGAIDIWGSICECVGHIQQLDHERLFGTESLAWVLIM
jgi:hypothetical protein